MRKVFAALLFCAFAVGNAFASDFNGKWTSTFSTVIGDQEYTYELHVEGTKLTGKATNAEGTTDLANGKVDGDNIWFTETLVEDGNTIVIAYVGKMEGDEIWFTRYVGGITTEELVAQRVKD
jgi:hypothetical protein